jgi:hypothetical protein
MAKTVFCRDGYIDLYVLKDQINISKIAYYNLKVNKDKTLTIKFYDDNKKLVKPYKVKDRS